MMLWYWVISRRKCRTHLMVDMLQDCFFFYFFIFFVFLKCYAYSITFTTWQITWGERQEQCTEREARTQRAHGRIKLEVFFLVDNKSHTQLKNWRVNCVWGFLLMEMTAFIIYNVAVLVNVAFLLAWTWPLDVSEIAPPAAVELVCFSLVGVFISTGSAALLHAPSQLRQSRPCQSKYARLLSLPDAGARCSNSAENSAQSTQEVTHQNTNITSSSFSK